MMKSRSFLYLRACCWGAAGWVRTAVPAVSGSTCIKAGLSALQLQQNEKNIKNPANKIFKNKLQRVLYGKVFIFYKWKKTSKVLSIGQIWSQISKVYLGSCVQLYSLAETPQLPHLPRHLGSYTKALLVSQDRRHLFVTPWFCRLDCSLAYYWEMLDLNPLLP